MMRVRSWCVVGLFVCGLVALPTRPAAAQQIVGTVTTVDGVPLEAVAVEAWTADRRIATVTTTRAGQFVFPETLSGDVVRLRAEALGFREGGVTLTPGIWIYRIELESAPINIEGLVVSAEAIDFCEQREHDTARDLWSAARGRYYQALDEMGIATYLAEADTVVPKQDIGPLQLPDLNLSQRGSSSILRFSWTRRIEREGYAYKVKRTDAARPYDSWIYPPLESDFASHFIEDSFGENHKFILLEEDAGESTILFCPRKDNRPYIRGTLTIAQDTTIRSAEWTFTTPEPNERAGGRAFFHPPTDEQSEAYLLPAEGLTWREVPGGLFLQSYQRYEGWLVAPGDSVPLLPFRGPSGGAGR